MHNQCIGISYHICKCVDWACRYVDDPGAVTSALQALLPVLDSFIHSFGSSAQASEQVSLGLAQTRLAFRAADFKQLCPDQAPPAVFLGVQLWRVSCCALQTLGTAAWPF